MTDMLRLAYQNMRTLRDEERARLEEADQLLAELGFVRVDLLDVPGFVVEALSSPSMSAVLRDLATPTHVAAEELERLRIDPVTGLSSFTPTDSVDEPEPGKFVPKKPKRESER